MTSYASEWIASVSIGVGCLTLANVSLTFVEADGRTAKPWARLFRLAMAPIAIYAFYDFGFGVCWDCRIYSQIQNYNGLSVIAQYGWMRIIDVCFVTLYDTDGPPRWILTATQELLPLPTSSLGRLAYGIDLLCSMRGLSWFSDRHFDFTTNIVKSSRIPYSNIARLQYLARTLPHFFGSLVFLDLMDILIKNTHFDAHALYPVSEGLPLHLQLVIAPVSAMWVFAQINLQADTLGMMFVGFGVSKPSVWPRFFCGLPLNAGSLPEFWGRRWHFMFRRPFDRLVVPFFGHSPANAVQTTEKKLEAKTFLRGSMIFLLSGLLHLVIMHRIPPSPYHPLPSRFWDPSILAFFLAQAVGLGLDGLLRSIMKRAFGSTREDTGLKVVRRIFVWAWLLWTARWYADGWVRKGLWDQYQEIVPLSLVRGILYGNWLSPSAPLPPLQ